MAQETIERKRLGITHGELLGAALVVLAAVLMFWKTTDVRLSALELRMNGTEKSNEVFMHKLDKLQETTNEINLALKDKVDRQK